jgi:tetratricopeptide (TPR) repeat protein
MESLSAIINNLSPGELKLVHHFYKLKNYGEYRKRVQLLNLIINNKISSNQEAAKMLGYDSNISSFKHLKARLKSDVLCMLLMQECSTKFCTPYAQATFDCRRFLMQGEILMSRGVYDEALDLLGKASKIAGKFELFAEGLQIEDLRRNHIASRGNMKDFEETCSAIEENYVRLGKVMMAKRYHYEITTPALLRVNSYAEYIRKSASALDEMAGETKLPDSSKVKLYNHLSSINYFSSIRDFENAQHHAVDLLRSVENDPVVKSKSNQAGVNMELANIYLNTGSYEKAIDHASKAVELFKPGMINQLHAQMALFFSFFRSNDLKNADKVLKAACSHRLVKNQHDTHLASRLQLLRASIAFKMTAYDECALVLRENAEYVRDKDGWMPGYFILDTLVLLEKKSFDLAFYRIEAFRKMIERNSMYKDEKRIHAITKILRLIVKEDGEFNKISAGQKDLLLLSEAAEEYYWNPAGYEVIRFDQWLVNKFSDRLHKRIA